MIGLALLLVPNILLLRVALGTIASTTSSWDWELLVESVQRIGTGTMYDWSAAGYVTDSTEYLYRYSPVLPYLMAPLVEYGLPLWRLLHVAALLLIPGPVALLALLAGPFWFDVAHGNFMVFVFVAGWLALSGNRWGMGAYVALSLLLPRPLMLPLLIWILWKRPESRSIFAGVAVVLVIATVVTGEAFAWLGTMTRGSDMVGTYWDWGPSRYLGLWWWPPGLVLACWLTWKGRIGLAAIAASPYILPYYLLVAAWDLHKPLEQRGVGGVAASR